MQFDTVANFLGLGTTELIIILVIILLIFGGSQLPKLARNLGSSAKELRKGISDAKGEFKSDKDSKDTASKSDTDKA